MILLQLEPSPDPIENGPAPQKIFFKKFLKRIEVYSNNVVISIQF